MCCRLFWGYGIYAISLYIPNDCLRFSEERKGGKKGKKKTPQKKTTGPDRAQGNDGGSHLITMLQWMRLVGAHELPWAAFCPSCWVRQQIKEVCYEARKKEVPALFNSAMRIPQYCCRSPITITEKSEIAPTLVTRLHLFFEDIAPTLLFCIRMGVFQLPYVAKVCFQK